MSNSSLPDSGKPSQPIDQVMRKVRDRLWSQLRKIEDAIDRIDPPSFAIAFDAGNIEYVRQQLVHIDTANAIALACTLALPMLAWVERETAVSPPPEADAILDAIEKAASTSEGGDA